MTREDALLQQLAERPDDRALRLVFSDWLLEEGDERGEVIALWARGDLSLTERRKVAKITAAHATRWLGPLAPLADPARTHFVGGFVDELTLAVARPPLPLENVVGEPRLSTLTSLCVPASRGTPCLARFLEDPVLRRLQRLELGAADWREVRTLASPSLRPPWVAVGSWGAFQKELAPLSSVPLFQQARALALATTEYVTPLMVQEIVGQVFEQHAALAGFEEVVLAARYSVIEGVAAWLLALAGAAQASPRAFPRLERWGVEASDVRLLLCGSASTGFQHLVIDLSAQRPNVEMRIAAAASVLVLLAPARLTSVEVKLWEGARLRSHEKHTLKAAARRSGTLERFEIHGEKILP